MKNLAVKIMNLEQVQEVKDNLSPLHKPLQNTIKKGAQKAVESAESLSDEGAKQATDAIKKAGELKEQAQDKAQEILDSKPANSTTTGQ